MLEYIFARNYGPADPKAPADKTQVRPNADDVPRIALLTGRFGRCALLAGAAAFWSMAGLFLWIGAGVVCPNGGCRVLELDRQLLGALHALQRPWLDAILTGATWLGSIAVLLPVALALAWRYRRRGPPGVALLLPIAVGGAWLLAHAGKLLVARPRPDLYPALISMPADLSFPSAHTLQITALARKTPIDMRMISSLREFIARESADGILLALAAAAAPALANSPLDFLYAALLGYALLRASLPQVLPPR